MVVLEEDATDGARVERLAWSVGPHVDYDLGAVGTRFLVRHSPRDGAADLCAHRILLDEDRVEKGRTTPRKILGGISERTINSRIGLGLASLALGTSFESSEQQRHGCEVVVVAGLEGYSEAGRVAAGHFELSGGHGWLLWWCFGWRQLLARWEVPRADQT